MFCFFFHDSFPKIFLVFSGGFRRFFFQSFLYVIIKFFTFSYTTCIIKCFSFIHS